MQSYVAEISKSVETMISTSDRSRSPQSSQSQIESMRSASMLPQPVPNALASAQVKLEFARPVVYRAAFGVARELPARGRDVSHAKIVAADAAALAARTALQVHGAIGYTWEVDLHVWMKRAWALEASWGTSGWHRARVATAVLGEEEVRP